VIFLAKSKSKFKCNKFIKVLRNIKWILLLVVVISGIIYLNSFTTKQQIERKSDLVSEKLVSISELATARYDYSNVISIKDNISFKDIAIPFTEKSFVIKYTGYITAGLDLTSATFTINKDILNINIPQCSILSHTVNEDEIFIFDEKTSIFNPLTMDDMLKEIIDEKDKTEAEVIGEGFLDQVTVDTIQLLKEIFSNSDFKEVKVNVVV